MNGLPAVNVARPTIFGNPFAHATDPAQAVEALRKGYHPVTGQPLDIDVYAVLPHTFETGGIVGEAVITGCVDRSDSPWFVGRYGILMREARPLPFIPCKGTLGFFVPDLSANPGASA